MKKTLAKIISIVLAAVLIFSAMPVSALTVDSVADLQKLGYVFNLLGSEGLSNELLTRSIFKGTSGINSNFASNPTTNSYVTYISSMQSYLQNESNKLDASLNLKAQIMMVALEAEAKYGQENMKSVATDESSEVFSLEVIREEGIYEMILDNEKQIKRLWETDANGDFLTLDDDFVDSLLWADPQVFFSNYGSHIVTRYTAGGEAYASYSGKDIKNTVDTANNWTVDGSFSLGVGEGFSTDIKVNLESNSDNSSTTQNGLKQVNAKVYGGSGFTGMESWSGGAVANWVDTVADKTVFINSDKTKLLPVWELIVDPQYIDRRVELEQYFNDNVDEQYAQLYGQYIYSPAADVNFTGYTLIQSAQDFYNIRNNLSGRYVLVNNIDLSDYEEWEPIGTRSQAFTGTLDGNGNTVSGLSITRCEDYAGLFGYNMGTVKNLSVSGNIDAKSQGENNVAYVGGIVGYNAGYVTNCRNAVTVNGQMELSDVQTKDEEAFSTAFDVYSADIEMAKAGLATSLSNNTQYQYGSSTKYIKLTGEANNITITVAGGSQPAFIVLEDADITGTINCSYTDASRKIFIISTGENNTVTGSSGKNAFDMPSEEIYICGDSPLTITGGVGKNGEGYTGDGVTGNDGQSGKAAVNASLLEVDLLSTLTLVGGKGGTGANGKTGLYGGDQPGNCNNAFNTYGSCKGSTGGTGDTGGNGGCGGKGGIALENVLCVAAYGDSRVSIVSGVGGDGGRGGNGGDGGDGQSGADGWVAAGFELGHDGGDGGAAGHGGDGGDGGYPGAIYNGDYNINDTATVTVISAHNGNGGRGGDGGDGGDGGRGGYSTDNWFYGHRRGGFGGSAGVGGDAGDGGDGYVAGQRGEKGIVGNPGAEGCSCTRKGALTADGKSGTDGNAVPRDVVRAIALTHSQEYKLYDDPMAFEGAVNNSAGEKLVSIGSEAEQNIIKELIKRGSGENYWIGLCRVASAGEKFNWFKWEDSTLLYIDEGSVNRIDTEGNIVSPAYSCFADGQPDNYNGEMPVYIASDGMWYDGALTAQYGYITETQLEAQTTNTPDKNALMVGGIVGINMGVIDSGYNMGKVSAYKAYSKYSGVSAYAGGIAGYNKGEIIRAYNTGEITAFAQSDSAYFYADAYSDNIVTSYDETDVTLSVGGMKTTSIAYSANGLENDSSYDEAQEIDSANQTKTVIEEYWRNSKLCVQGLESIEYLIDSSLNKETVSLTFSGQQVGYYSANYNFCNTGITTITVSYEEGGVRYVRYIPVKVVEATAVEVQVYKYPATEFEEGESFSSQGLALKVVYNNGATKLLSSKSFTVKEPEMTQGNKAVSVNYTTEEGTDLSCTYNIKVGNVLTGDVDGNGTVATTDLATLKLYLAGAVSVDDIVYDNADMDLNTVVETKDLAELKLKLAGN